MRGGPIEHRAFSELPDLLRPTDLLVVNDTRVIAARVFGRIAPRSAKVEVLLLRPAARLAYDPHATRWLALTRPGRKVRPGGRIDFGTAGHATVENVHPNGTRELEFHLDVPFASFLENAGRLPLPPYIRNDSAQAQADYQTVFAAHPGSVAAPTAGLHFTSNVLSRLEQNGIERCTLTLEVGLGTFRPIKTRSLDEHTMFAEAFEIPAETARAVTEAKEEGRRVVAVGTTVVRALEAAALKGGLPSAGRGETNLFIKPGFQFRVVDALLTNFHMPQSTLLVLVSAFAGRERILRAYEEAARQRYRFLSFGDAMLIER